MARGTSYIDASGRERHLVLTVLHFERLRDRLGVDLLGQPGLSAVQELDLCRLVRVLHCLLDPDGPYEAFAASHVGDALDAASAALLEAYIRFFPQRQQVPLRILQEKQERALDELIVRMEELARTFDAASTLEQTVRQTAAALQEPAASGNGSGERPAF